MAHTFSRFMAGVLMAGMAGAAGAAFGMESPAGALGPLQAAHSQGLRSAGSRVPAVDFRGQPASPETLRIARWAFEQGNAHQRPFAVVDKRQARIYVFSANGRLAGSAPALLGLAKGDDAVPGLGQRPPEEIKPHERTTPAGRFDAEPGRNLKGESVVWVDYDAGLAIHRLRPAKAVEKRPQRLRSASPQDHRISLGCVVVPPAFYDGVVGPLLGHQRSVIYVLPDTRDLASTFGASSRLAMNDRSRP